MKPGGPACGSSPPTAPAWAVPSSSSARRLSTRCRTLKTCRRRPGLDDFSLIGISGGTPYALAALSRLAHRVKTVTVISGMGPMRLPGALSGMDRRRRIVLEVGSRWPHLARRGFRKAHESVSRRPGRAARSLDHDLVGA